MALTISRSRFGYPPQARQLSAEAEAFGIREGLLPWSPNRIVGASATVHGTIAGLAHRSASTTAGIVRRIIPGIGNASGQFIGLLTTFRTTTTTANAVVGALGSESGSTGNTLFNLYLTGTGNADLTLVYGGSSTSLSFAATGVKLNDGNVHTVLAVAGPFTSSAENLTASIYVDGRRVATSATTQTLGIANAYTSVLAGGWRRGGADAVYTTQGDVDTLAVLPVLRWSMPSDAEALAVSGSPWRLFERRRIFVPVSVGGGGSWSVSLTETASASDSLAAATTALVSLIESASSADIITAATIAAVALTEAASASDTQTASYSATGSGSVTESASAADTLDAATTMLRALTETASADDQLAAATTMLRAISESASAADTPAASYSGAGAATIEELTSATDALTAAATLLVTILEAGSADDALQAATTMVRAITEQATAVDEVTAALPGSTWDVSIEELAAAVDLITGYAAGGLTASPLGLRLSQGGRIARLTTTARPPRLSTRTR